MKILFLDIDGVLNTHNPHENGFCGIDAEQVQHLNTILREDEEIQIVLSSAWRYTFDNQHVVDHLLCVFGVNCFGQVHGVTERDPWSEDFPPYENREWWAKMGITWRQDQITKYIDEHKPSRWAILDDLPLCEATVPWFFQTDPNVGLTAEIASAVVAYFKEE